MVLAMFWSSLPTMLKLFRDTSWPVVLWWSWMGDGAFMCSLNLSAKSPTRFPNVFLFTVYHATPEPVDHSTLLQDCISIFGVYQEVPWLCCLLWKTFLPNVFCRCFYSFHPCLGYMGQLCRACCCLFCWLHWLPLD